MITPDQLAKLFHDQYERLAPEYGYKTREASAVPWDEVPKQNKDLMIAVAGRIIYKLKLNQEKKMTEAQFITPDQLAEKLGVSGVKLRNFLRLNFKRPPSEKNKPWKITPEMIIKAARHFQ